MKYIKRLLIVVVILLLGVTTLIYYYNNHIVVRNEIIESEKFNETIDGYSIVYFSDLHYTNFINEKFLNRVVETINKENPDLVIFGGDLIDKLQDTSISDKEKESLMNGLKKIKNKNGKYAILGNHDYSNGSYEIIKDIYAKSEFTLLKDDCVSLKLNDDNNINLLGVDSLFFSWDIFLDSYNNIDTNNFTFAIIHHPDLIDYMLNINFDYVLSAHSHGGQIYIPMFKEKYNIYGCNKYFVGKYESNNSNGKFIIDVSSGLGRTRFNVRLNTNAEIVKYELRSK